MWFLKQPISCVSSVLFDKKLWEIRKKSGNFPKVQSQHMAGLVFPSSNPAFTQLWCPVSKALFLTKVKPPAQKKSSCCVFIVEVAQPSAGKLYSPECYSLACPWWLYGTLGPRLYAQLTWDWSLWYAFTSLATQLGFYKPPLEGLLHFKTANVHL